MLSAGLELVEAKERQKNHMEKRPVGKNVAVQQFGGITPVPKSIQIKLRNFTL